MAFSRSSSVPSTAEGTHTFTLVLSSSTTDIKAPSKAAFQTDGDSCPKDLRPLIAYIRKQLDHGVYVDGDLVRVTKDTVVDLGNGRSIELKKGDPKLFFGHVVAKASDVDVSTDLDW